MNPPNFRFACLSYSVYYKLIMTIGIFFLCDNHTNLPADCTVKLVPITRSKSLFSISSLALSLIPFSTDSPKNTRESCKLPPHSYLMHILPVS